MNIYTINYGYICTTHLISSHYLIRPIPTYNPKPASLRRPPPGHTKN